ncbi:calcium-binding allergen Ole e 8-like [Carya illinoinensis]|uniref:calcium-binding allergen Ole e 8-like n=1 Tax=Carya illinoinensis TaxID=32201 RepID=UPI001C71EC89|nr:calcium-binding allergen Ole e 8-like [Carya illinoinensis]
MSVTRGVTFPPVSYYTFATFHLLFASPQISLSILYTKNPPILLQNLLIRENLTESNLQQPCRLTQPRIPSVYLQNMDEVEKVFNRFDTNGDGKISESELGAVLSSLGTAFADEGELRRIMAELDFDNNGFISLLEFVAFCRSGSEDG